MSPNAALPTVGPVNLTGSSGSTAAVKHERFVMYSSESRYPLLAWSASAWRLRLANIRAELRPVSTMMGHKKVQTMAHNTRLPRVEPPSAVSTC
jgi:hypothetical protein